MPAPRHFLDLPSIEPKTLKSILKRAHELKAQKFNPPQLFSGLSLAMVFDKRSTRTRMSFEVAMKQLGGHTLVMNMEELQINGAVHSDVELELDCGELLSGELIYEAPPGTDRVSDLLNSRAARFLLLVSGQRTLCVRRDAVARIHL